MICSLYCRNLPPGLYLEYNALHQYLGETFASSMAPRLQSPLHYDPS